MSKPQLVVLGFLKKQPLYGYRIGQVVEELRLPVWAGIKLPSIYKALQHLENSGHIRGEQITEGNNPPRTVYHINPSGEALLREMVKESLLDPQLLHHDWWLALSFSWASITRVDMLNAIENRLEKLGSHQNEGQELKCRKLMEEGQMPFVMSFIMQLGSRHLEVEINTLKELSEAIRSGQYEDTFFCEECVK